MTPTIPRETVGSRASWLVARALGRLPSPRRLVLLALLLILPALVLRLFTSVYPFAVTAWLSLTDASPMNASDRFVGLANYAALLSDDVALQATAFTMVFALGSTALELVVGLALALLMNATFRLQGLTRALALIPWAIPAIVTALGFRFMLADGFGIVPDLMGKVGLHVEWLTSPLGAQAAVILVNTWRSVPFVALIILAGLQGIPGELYEAAQLDGAGFFKVLRSIVIPLVTPLLITMGIFMLIFQIGGFDVILGLTGGGPGTATQVLSYLTFQEAFIGLEYGRASAESMVLFALVLITGLAALVLFRRTEVEL